MADKDNAKDLVNAVEKIAAAKAAKENQSLASELEKSFSNLAGVQKKLARENAKTADAIKDGAAAELCLSGLGADPDGAPHAAGRADVLAVYGRRRRDGSEAGGRAGAACQHLGR